MKRLFWGWCFILLDVSFALGRGGASYRVDLLPDFVGWLLLLAGLKLLAPESGLFGRLRPFALGMAACTAALWVCGSLGLFPGGLWPLAAALVEFYVSWALLVAIRDVEERRGAALNSGGLKRAWTALLVVRGCGVLLAGAAQPVFLGLARQGALSAAAALGGLAAWALAATGVSVWFLASLWKSAKLYGALPPRETPPGPELD